MTIGTNIRMSDKLIKKTSDNESITNIKNNVSKKNKAKVTDNTTKMTFYVRTELLEKLYNFSYWDRHSVTEAFNIILEDGLKGKNTKNRPS